MTKPNVVMIVVDCLRAATLVGPERSARTPNLDNLAERGALFSTCVTQQNFTGPCFASLLTGTYSQRNQLKCQLGYKLSDSIRTVAEIFRMNGYHTYAEVSGPLHSIFGLNRGFEHYRFRKSSEYFDDALRKSLLQQIQDGSIKKPYFLLLHLWDIHAPRQVTEQFDKPEYGREEFDRALSTLDHRLGDFLDALGEDTVVVFTGDHGEKLPSDEILPGTALAYFSEKLDLDAFSIWNHISPDIYFKIMLAVVHWMAERAPKNLREKFLQFYYATERAMGGKQLVRRTKLYLRVNRNEGHGIHIYDYLCCVPLILSGGGVFPKSFRSGKQARQIDIVPTLVDALELKTDGPVEMDGQSLGGLLHGGDYEEKPALVEAYGTVMYPEGFSVKGIRTPDHKFSFSPGDPDCPKELYDLRADPGERKNLAEEQPEICKELEDLHTYQSSQIEGEESAMSAEEEAEMADRLRDLGYIE